MYNKCVECASSIKKIIGDFSPQIAVILGSGLGGFANAVDVKFTVDYKDIMGFPVSTVSGHQGRFLFGLYGGRRIAVMQGRVHYYEGFSSEDTVLPIRVLNLLGARSIILTNAAGGINGDFHKGDLMLICDHISFFVKNPLIGKNIDEFGVRFPDMSNVYDSGIQTVALSAAREIGLELKKGVYAQVTGPQYETPAEIRALKLFGADAVGMSTVSEAIAARHCGMQICGISLIANMAAGIEGKPLGHTDVLDAAKQAEKNFSILLCKIIENMPDGT